MEFGEPKDPRQEEEILREFYRTSEIRDAITRDIYILGLPDALRVVVGDCGNLLLISDEGEYVADLESRSVAPSVRLEIVREQLRERLG